MCTCDRRRSTKLGKTGEDTQPRGRPTLDLGTAVARRSPERARRAEQPGERLRRHGKGLDGVQHLLTISGNSQTASLPLQPLEIQA